MTERERWLRKYEADPEFRLQRLLKLRRRNYRATGGFPSRSAYQVEIDKARDEIAAREAKS